MNELFFMYLAIGCLIAFWVARPLHVAVHELSHTLTAAILTRSPLRMQLGEQVEGTWSWGRLTISFELRRWRSGKFRYASKTVSLPKRAIILAAGPLGTFALTALAIAGMVTTKLHFLQLIWVPFIAYGVKMLILSLYPRILKDSKTGKVIKTDGYRLSRMPWSQKPTAHI